MDHLDIASAVDYGDHNSNDLCHGHNSRHQKQGLQSEGIENDSTEIEHADPDHVDSEKLTALAEHDKNIKSKSEKADMKHGVKRNSKKTLQKEKKASQSLGGKRYFLRSSLDGVRVLRSMSKGKSKTPAESLDGVRVLQSMSKGKSKTPAESLDGVRVLRSMSKGKRKTPAESLDGVRVLRSMSKGKSKTPVESVTPPVNPTTKRKKKRKVKGASNDEFSATRKRVRYLLTRINYEQNLIDAYSSEGWKGQSLEKIRPEKELERAKSEILRCKLKIRDSFQCLDSLLSEGRFQESLFDSDGQICSEDIFCAKCSSKDLSVDNDIILCDGACDRGFHQKCLNPPLLSENIPLGDDGWLCPACDCKVDCIDLLNEFQGSDLSIEDSWEEVFPEAAAIANSDKKYDLSNLSSDDSEDENYDPDASEVDTEDHLEESSSEEDHEEKSSSEESYFTDSSGDSGASKKSKHYDDIGLSSDDSEDDNYDPEGPDPDKEIQKGDSSSEESDFTSDSDDFCAELSKIGGTDEVSASSLPNLKPLHPSGEGECVSDRNKNATNSELPSMLVPDLSQRNALPVSRRRQRDHLDYKKLYDETYGKASSDSSDDEDWSDKSALKKGKKEDYVEETDVLPKARAQSIENYRSSGRAKRKATVENMVTKSDLVQKQVLLGVSEGTPKNAYQQKLQSSSLQHMQKHGDPREPDSNGSEAATSVQRRSDPVVTQKLHDSFMENQYPSRETKERLAIEFGMTSQQISKWFENARHSMRVSAREANPAVISTPDEGTSSTKAKRNNDKPDKGRAKNCASSGSKGKKSVGERNDEVGAGHHTGNGKNMEDTPENSRKKAIERELRKRRRSR